MSPASYQTAPPRAVFLQITTSWSDTRPDRGHACHPSTSGKRDSNPRPQPWQGCALPTELFPRSGEDFSARPAAAQRPGTGSCSSEGGSGGEGDRTPDLVNAIHALSQLSYAPASIVPPSNGTVASTETYPRAGTSVNEGHWAREAARRVDTKDDSAAMSNESLPDPLPEPTVADILAHAEPLAPRRTRRRAAAKNLGVYDSDRDILDQYLFEVSQTPLLTPPQEMAIARLIQAGDPDAMQELIKRNLRFVISVAKKYQNRGLGLSDLIGEGNLGLLTAARKFDPDQGVKFISYAVWWIRQSILAALARQGRTVRVPLNRTADLSRITRVSETLRQELRREPTFEEIAQQTGLAVDVVRSLAALNNAEVRLDSPLEPEGERSLIERFVADEMPDTEEEAMSRFLTDEIEQALSTLPPRDAKVLRLYFGLEGGREHTLEEIGSMLGVTRERVRQLRDPALKPLREGDVGRALGSFAA